MSKYNVGLRNVGSYQVSGTPWLTGSSIAAATTYNVSGVAGEMMLTFPYVTQTVTVVNTSASGATLIHFVSSSSPGNVHTNKHFITLNAGESISFDVKCKEIFLHNNSGTQTFEMIADLTNIPIRRMYELTGSGITD
jgi:hypothetical protein